MGLEASNVKGWARCVVCEAYDVNLGVGSHDDVTERIVV